MLSACLTGHMALTSQAELMSLFQIPCLQSGATIAHTQAIMRTECQGDA